jgi:hypothetical protein
MDDAGSRTACKRKAAIVTLTVDLRPEEVAILETRARSLGVDVATVLRGLIAQLAGTAGPLYETASLDEWEKALDELGDDIDPMIPPLPNEALRRETLYADRG